MLTGQKQLENSTQQNGDHADNVNFLPRTQRFSNFFPNQ